MIIQYYTHYACVPAAADFAYIEYNNGETADR